MPVTGQMSDTVPPKLLSGLLLSESSGDLANDLLPFCRTDRCRLFRRFTVFVELWAATRLAISETRNGQYGGPHNCGRRGFRFDRIATGIHDFWRLAAFR